MHRSFECSTTPSSVGKMQVTGQTAAEGASVQCMQAIETERSPGRPSLSVTTRRRLMPQGTSFSFLHAVTHALQSMQRSASQRNFILAIAFLIPLESDREWPSVPAFPWPDRSHKLSGHSHSRRAHRDPRPWDIY